MGEGQHVGAIALLVLLATLVLAPVLAVILPSVRRGLSCGHFACGAVSEWAVRTLQGGGAGVVCPQGASTKNPPTETLSRGV